MSAFCNFEKFEGIVEMDIENIRGIESTKVGRILREECISETSLYSRLLRILSEVFSVSLSQFSSVSIMEL